MIVVRRAQLSDSEAIARVLYESFVEYESQYTGAAFAATVLDPDKVRQRLEEGPGWIGVFDVEMVWLQTVQNRSEATAFNSEKYTLLVDRSLAFGLRLHQPKEDQDSTPKASNS